MVSLMPGCEKPAAPVAPPPPQVQIIETKAEDVPITMEWIGTLQGFVNASIRSQVEGILLSQNYEEGAAVTKGAVLFELDDRSYVSAVNDAKGKLAQAEANFAKSDLETRRLAALVQSRAVSQQDYDNSVQASLANKAVVESAKATLEKAELNLSFTKIISPIDGVAGLAKAQVGDLITPNSTELTTVSTVNPIKAYFTVSEQEYLNYRADNPGIRPGRSEGISEFELVLANGTIVPQKGKFYASDVSVNRNTGALQLCAVFENPDDILKPGGYGRVRATTRVAKNAIKIPSRAVHELQGIHQVTVVTPENTASIRQVKTGPQIGSEWLILEGLQAGEKVVVEGIQKVRDGTPVSAVPYQPLVQAAAGK